MTNNNVVNKDWKEILIKQIKREKLLDGIATNRKLINFFEEYFRELRSELFDYTDDKELITTHKWKGGGDLRIGITNNRSVSIQYDKGIKYVTLKLIHEDLDGNLDRNETIAVIYASDESGLILVELDNEGNYLKKDRPLTVKWLDEKIKESLLSVLV